MSELEFRVIGCSDVMQNILSAFDETFWSRIVVYPCLWQGDIVKVLGQAQIFLFVSLL